MSDPEKTLAYQQNWAALAGADLDQHACILALAEQLDLMHTAVSRQLTKNWFNVAYLTIISWHNAQGKVINDTTISDNPSVLLPEQNGIAALCHLEGVTFVRVSLRLEQSPLHPVGYSVETITLSCLRILFS